MDSFFDFLKQRSAPPTPKLFIVFGLLFLGVAIVGICTDKIRPGAVGRILGGLLGPLLIVIGLGIELNAARKQIVTARPALSTPVPTYSKPNTYDPKLSSYDPKKAIDLINR